MNLSRACGCVLCRMELQLFAELTDGRKEAYEALLATTPRLAEFPTPSLLLAHLRSSRADAGTDEIFRGLLRTEPAYFAFVEGFFVLAFLPVIHGTTRKIARQNLELSKDDIIQQALYSLVQFLRSADLRARESHFAFAISRAVKRQSFEWANRERVSAGNQDIAAEIFEALFVEESLERHATLRHFLHRCVSKGLLTDAELNLLIQFKLEGNTGEDLGNSAGITSNALRQRMKRLLAKLRRLARRDSRQQPP